MNDRRAQMAKQLVEFAVLPHTVAGWLVQSDELHITALHTVAKIGDLRHRQNCMSVGACRHVIDQIHDAVLQPTGCKAVHDVEYERAFITVHVSRISEFYLLLKLKQTL